MKRKLGALTAALFLTIALLAGTRAASILTIDWWSVDGGGDRSSGGAYVLDHTTGQADAGVLSGGAFTVTGGYWVVALPRSSIHLPLIKR
jgi:hypothetical protein